MQSTYWTGAKPGANDQLERRSPEPESAARFCGFAQGPRANSLGNKDSILGSGERVSIVVPLKSTLHWILILIGAFAFALRRLSIQK